MAKFSGAFSAGLILRQRLTDWASDRLVQVFASATGVRKTGVRSDPDRSIVGSNEAERRFRSTRAHRTSFGCVNCRLQ